MALADFQRISFDEANPGLTGALRALQIAQMPGQMQQTWLQNQKMQAVMPYLGPQAQEQVKQMQLANQQTESVLPYYKDIQLAKMQKQIADAKHNLALVSLYEKAGLLPPGSSMSFLSNSGGMDNSQPSQDNQQYQNTSNQQGYIQQNSGISSQSENQVQPNIDSSSQVPTSNDQPIFGQSLPQPTDQEKAFGFLHMPNSYKSRLDIAQKMQENNIEDIRQEANNASMTAIPAIQNSQLLDSALYSFEEVPDSFKGPGLGKMNLDNWIGFARSKLDPEGFSKAKKFAGIISELKPMNLQIVKSAIGPGSKMNIPDTLLAQALGPTPTDTMESLISKMGIQKSIYTRAQEGANYWNYVNSHPETMPRPSVLKQQYQNYLNQFPMTDEKGNFLPYNPGHWKLFVTPKALKQFSEKGFYSPSKEEISKFDKENHISKELNKKSKYLFKNYEKKQATPMMSKTASGKVMLQEPETGRWYYND